jgi:hypothetical protein
MTLSSILNTITPIIAAAISISPGHAQPGIGFGMVGIALGQSAQISALNLGSSKSTPDSGCTVALQFLDVKGNVLKQSTFTLGQGKAASLEIGRDKVPGTDLRAEIRAVLLFGYSGGAPPGPTVLQQYDCNILSSIQVFDNDTGKTNYIVTDTKPLPAPDPRAIARVGGARSK